MRVTKGNKAGDRSVRGAPCGGNKGLKSSGPLCQRGTVWGNKGYKAVARSVREAPYGGNKGLQNSGPLCPPGTVWG